MALISCKECSKEVSDKASKCPHCGAQLKSSGIAKTFKFLLISILILVVLLFMIGSCTPEYERQARENRNVCEKYLAGGNPMTINWQECQRIYNEAISKGKEEARNKKNGG